MKAATSAHNLLCLFCLLVVESIYASTPPSFGSFLGTLTHEKRGVQQLARLELIPSREKSDRLELTAVLVLYFGGFDSSEYISFHYDSVNYNLLTGKLLFEQSDQDLIVKTTALSAGGDELVAEVWSALGGGRIGQLRVKIADMISFPTPLEGSVSENILARAILGPRRCFAPGFTCSRGGRVVSFPIR